jgi:hypothetical protein
MSSHPYHSKFMTLTAIFVDPNVLSQFEQGELYAAAERQAENIARSPFSAMLKVFVAYRLRKSDESVKVLVKRLANEVLEVSRNTVLGLPRECKLKVVYQAYLHDSGPILQVSPTAQSQAQLDLTLMQLATLASKSEDTETVITARMPTARVMAQEMESPMATVDDTTS